jgi:methanogenic corrinoid protein MtbC1
MYTIKEAARLTGVAEASLRAWERRYGVVTPRRSEAGYRLYDDDALATVSAMRQLVDARWSPAVAARALLDGTAPVLPLAPPSDLRSQADAGLSNATTYMESFLASARQMNITGIEESLDRGFALGSFEHVVDSWLFPTLEALGEAWARGEIDVAGEHAASHAVHRRLAAAYNAAGNRSTGPGVVVGLPPGSRHELGALAFATALRRNGMNVLYLGADVPVTSWQLSATTHRARAAVLAVVTDDDRPAALAAAHRLLNNDPTLLVASGGACGARLAPQVRDLPPTIGTAAHEVSTLLQRTAQPS